MMKLQGHKVLLILLLAVFLTTTVSCQENTDDEEFQTTETEKEVEEELEWLPLEVKASAYNSIEAQTKKGNVGIAAWGDVLEPGMKAIAVSNDLIAMGLTHNTPIKIEGLEGIYYVKDRMHHRWKKKIDIYMGVNVQKARNWGVRNITIYYAPKE